MPVHTSKDRLAQLLDRFETQVNQAQASGTANPLMLAMAMVLPFVRLEIEKMADSGELDRFLDHMLGWYAALRADDAPAILVSRRVDVPDGAPWIRYLRPFTDSDANLDAFLNGAAGDSLSVVVDEPVRVSDPFGWL